MACRQRPGGEVHVNGSHGLSVGNWLTPREREVLTQIVEGASNKEAGRQLGISPRTIEVHRAHIMEKIGAKNAADLLRIVLRENGALRTSRATPSGSVARAAGDAGIQRARHKPG